MTGFGRSEGETRLGKVQVESRSVNHRYSDINIKIPKRFVIFENRIKEMIRSQVARGRVDVTIKIDSLESEKVHLQADLHLAEQYVQALLALKERFQLKGEISLELLAGAKDLITAKEENGDLEPYWEEVAQILNRSLKEMDAMKCLEGEILRRDIELRLGQIHQKLQEIESHSAFSLEAYHRRLRERVRTLLDGVELDPNRLYQEIALFAERVDITEEIVRAKSHLHQFTQFFLSKEPIGRKMDFLVQEIYREINTISSKANDAEISQWVVDIKSELEKIREQVQNIE